MNGRRKRQVVVVAFIFGIVVIGDVIIHVLGTTIWGRVRGSASGQLDCLI